MKHVAVETVGALERDVLLCGQKPNPHYLPGALPREGGEKMSYIDTFDHEFVGFFVGLPLYHPTETVDAATAHADEFGCNAATLVLGGGPGEHPALLVTDPGGAVLHFLHFWLELAPDGRPNGVSAHTLLPDAPPAERCVCFAGWHVRDYAAFYERCQSPAVPTPYGAELHGHVEEWILGSLGEFIYLAMPELAASTLKALPDICRRVNRPIFYNVTILPPNYGAPAGRSHRNKGIVWGNYPWSSAREGAGEEV